MKGGSCMGRAERWNHLEPSDLERMSTAALEDLLLQDFHAPDQGEDGMSGLYRAAQVLAGREPDCADAVNRSWENFREKYLPFVADSVPFGEDGGTPSSDAAHGRRHAPLRRWVQVAVAAAALCVLLSVSVAAASGGRDLWKRLAQWTDEQIWLSEDQIVPADRDDLHIPEEQREYSSLREALEDYGLTRPVAPRWLPEGFELNNLAVEDMAGVELIFFASYARDGDYLVMQVAIYLDREDGNVGSTGSFQKDEGDPVLYEAGGVIHMLGTNAGRPIAVWANGPAECAVSGDITMEELERMIDSIYE